MADPAIAKPLGRPRTVGADEAIVRATLELLTEVGLEGTTIRAIAERANVARATIYLRWSNRDALLSAAVLVAIGGAPYPLSGDLETDIRRAGPRARSAFGSAAFQAILPEVVRGLLARDTEATYTSFAPNYALVKREYERLAGESGFRTDLDAAAVMDLVVGGHLNHLLATGHTPSAKLSNQMLDIVIAGARAKPRKA